MKKQVMRVDFHDDALAVLREANRLAKGTSADPAFMDAYRLLFRYVLDRSFEFVVEDLLDLPEEIIGEC